MSKGIIGKKIGMSQHFNGGELIPVTVIQAGPCKVVQKKTAETDGYEAVQLSFDEEKKKNRITKAMAGHFKKTETPPHRVLREFRTGEFEAGQVVTIDMFKKGDMITVSGTTKGKGFAGVMKRHNFSGSQKTHGQSDRMRAPGSMGASSYPSRTYRGQRMGGRMGGDVVTTLGLRVMRVIPEENLILVSGSIPGSPDGIVKIRRSTRK